VRASLIETGMRRIVKGTAEAFGATAEGDFRMIFAPTVNDAAQANFRGGCLCRGGRGR